MAVRSAALLVLGMLVAGTATTASAEVQSAGAPIALEVASQPVGAIAGAAPDHVDPAPAGVDVHRHVPTGELLPRSQARGERTAELVRLRSAAARGSDEPELNEAAAVTPSGTSALPGLSNHVARSCAGTGTDGNRVQALYVVEADDSDRFNSVLPLLKDEIANVDDTFALSAAETDGSRRIRWVFASAETCEPTITKVVVPAGSLASFSASVSALRAAGFTNPGRKYLAFADTAVLCGVGHIYRDNRRTGNANDGTSTAMFARVDTGCWQTTSSHGSTAAHELMHTFGGVQQGAPHVTPYGHCTDRYDLMCYSDGSGAAMVNVCPSSHRALFDCSNDDYFHTSPPSGSYLATHWNSADSSFLDAAAAPRPAPTPATPTSTPVASTAPTSEPTTPVSAPSVTISGPSSMLPGLPAELVATASGPGTFAWSTSDADCVFGGSSSAILNIRCAADRAGVFQATITFSASDGRVASATHIVSPSTASATLTPSLSAAKASLPKGGATNITARLLQGQVPVRGHVAVAGSTDGRSWQLLVSDVDTGADGAVTFVAKPTRTTYLRLITQVASGTGWSVTRHSVLRVTVTKAAAKLSIKVRKGNPTRISGRLTTTEAPHGVAKRTVLLQYRPAGTAKWRTLRSLTTNSGGHVSTAVPKRRGTYYRLRYAGTAAELPDLSKAAYLR